jgi:hypothetical protein
MASFIALAAVLALLSWSAHAEVAGTGEQTQQSQAAGQKDHKQLDRPLEVPAACVQRFD